MLVGAGADPCAGAAGSGYARCSGYVRTPLRLRTPLAVGVRRSWLALCWAYAGCSLCLRTLAVPTPAAPAHIGAQ